MGDLTLFEALTGGAFDRLNWQHSGEFDQNFSKSQIPGGLPGGGGAWAVLELTDTKVACIELSVTNLRLFTRVPALSVFSSF